MILLRSGKHNIELLEVISGYIVRSVTPQGRIVWQKHFRSLDTARREFYLLTEK